MKYFKEFCAKKIMMELKKAAKIEKKLRKKK